MAIKFDTASTLDELFSWWDATNGGKDNDSVIHIDKGAVIANCCFIDSLERIVMGDGAELRDLSGLSEVDSGQAGSIGLRCKLRGLINVERINWDSLPVGVKLYDLKVFNDFEAGSAPKDSAFYGLISVAKFRHFKIGDNSVFTGLGLLSRFENVKFGKRSAFKGLNGQWVEPSGFIKNCTAAERVVFRFKKPPILVASAYKGFDGVEFYSKKGFVWHFNDRFPDNAYFSCFPHPSDIDGPVMLSKGMGFDCSDVSEIDEIEHLWGPGVAVPEQIKLYGFKGNIRNIPEMFWGRILSLQAK